MPALVPGADQLEPDGAGRGVGGQQRLLGDNPHVAGAGHVQAGGVAEDLVGVLSAALGGGEERVKL